LVQRFLKGYFQKYGFAILFSKVYIYIMSIVGVGITNIESVSLQVPLYWSNANAKPTELPLLDRTIQGYASGINSLGQIVGICFDFNKGSELALPVIWTTSNTKPKQLPLLDGTTGGAGNSINNLGQIVGSCGAGDLSIPVIWANYNEKPTPLQTFDKTTSTYASGINNLGQIVGYIANADNYSTTSVIWNDSKAKPTKLPFPNKKYDNILFFFSLISINDLSQIVSYSYDSSRDFNYIPFFFRSVNATPVKLPLLPGTIDGVAFGINNLGQIVGSVLNDTFSSPVIWTNANATPTFLQTSTTFTYTFPLGISEPPAPAPISNICFPAGTPVQTDQGVVNIDAIDSQIHTIASQSILHVTKTTTLDNYLICFDKHSLGRNVPSAKTLMTKDHKIMFEGRMVQAYRFLDYSDKVKKVKYNGETLYNVLLAEHSTIHVNNMVCETLHPENIIAKLYMRKADEQPRLVYQLNNALENKDILSYKDVVNRLTHNL
jgi:uncharacterized membrane protein